MSQAKQASVKRVSIEWPADRAAFEAWACEEPSDANITAGYAPRYPLSKVDPRRLAAKARTAGKPVRAAARKPKPKPRRRTRSTPSAA